MTGHRCKQPAFVFGEMVMFRPEPEKTNRMKATGTWHIGTFMGADSRSVEHLIINKTGLYKCRSMKRMPRDKAFNGDCLEEAKC